MFGVSPPIRGGRCGGAANPMTLDRNWQLHARYGVQNNLQALTERSKHRRHFNNARHIGDPRILVTTTDENNHVGQEALKNISTTDGSSNCVPFTCQTRYFKPQEIK